MSNQNEVFSEKLHEVSESLKALEIAHRESLEWAHTQRDFANDAAAKGDDARLNAGAMELRITELEAQLSEAIWLLGESKKTAPDPSYWRRMREFMASQGSDQPLGSNPIIGFLDGSYKASLERNGSATIWAEQQKARNPIPVMLSPSGKEKN